MILGSVGRGLAKARQDPGREVRKEGQALGRHIPAAELTGEGWAGVRPGLRTALGRGRRCQACVPGAGCEGSQNHPHQPSKARRPSSPDSVPAPWPTSAWHAHPPTLGLAQGPSLRPVQESPLSLPSPTSPPFMPLGARQPTVWAPPPLRAPRPAAACGAIDCGCPPVMVEVAWLPAGPESLGSAHSQEPPSISLPPACSHLSLSSLQAWAAAHVWAAGQSQTSCPARQHPLRCQVTSHTGCLGSEVLPRCMALPPNTPWVIRARPAGPACPEPWPPLGPGTLRTCQHHPLRGL